MGDLISTQVGLTNEIDLRLQVIILGFIRPEQNFDSLEALVDAIRC